MRSAGVEGGVDAKIDCVNTFAEGRNMSVCTDNTNAKDQPRVQHPVFVTT